MGLLILISLGLINIEKIESNNFKSFRHDIIVRYYCHKNKVEYKLVKSIIKYESENKQYAKNNEYKQLKDLYWVKKAICDNGLNKNDKHIYCAYGKMQVLYLSCVALGYKGKPSGLYNETVNIKYGTMILKQKYEKYHRTKDRICAYNSGSVRCINGIYINQKYVAKVYRHYKSIGGKA